jgi:hypothetical protein
MRRKFGFRRGTSRKSAHLLDEFHGAGGYGESVMLRWNSAIREEEEAMLSAREHDDEFCKMLRAAIEEGAESCPIGVSTEPGTKKPIILKSAA